MAATASYPGLAHSQQKKGDSPPYVVRSHGGVVAADHPLGSQAGAAVLAAGGTAADAGVATLLVQGVANPFASGLGGGGFCLYRPAGGEVAVLDFRERAPGKATHDMYVVDGKASIALQLDGGLAVGVPGEPLGLEQLHQKFGKLSWAKVVEPARKMAADGFPAGQLLVERLASNAEKLEKHPKLADEFQVGRHWVARGKTLKRPELARTLRLLQKKGARPFYDGPIARAIVAADDAAGGILTTKDLRNYQVSWRKPVHGTYRGYDVYSMPPPSSGGTTLIETLNILERYDLHTLGRSIETIHRVTEALKHAFADRARWLGDSDFVEVPVDRLISKSYAASLKIRPDGVLPLQEYGTKAPPPTDHGTTHVSVIDGEGNMLACTSTINTSFGSKVFVPKYGMILNNEMGDFTAKPGEPNNYGLVGTEQNSVAPGKRPLSSMSPTLVLHDGAPFLAVGASGGPTIITGTLLAILRLVDFRTTPGEAVSLPRIHHQWLPDTLFAEKLSPAAVRILEERGHHVEIHEAYNSVQLVLRKPDGTLVGVSDPRKHGRPAAAAGKTSGK